MSEPGPISFSLLAAAIAVAGPVLGPYALVVFASAVGCALVMSTEPMPSRWAGVRFIAMGTCVSLLLTGPALWAIQRWTDIPASIALVPVAFLLGLARNRLITFVNQALDAVAAAVSALITAAANRRGGGQ